MSEEDPTSWLGDPVGMHVTGAGDVVISVPPRERSTIVVSLRGAPSLDEDAVFVRVNLEGARGLVRSLNAAIAQVEEHAGGGDA
jgi:hypothetical protein